MTFLHPLYLAGLALMSVPVIIHLWFRRRMKKVPFSTLKFLKHAEARRLGWLRFRELLVLAARCLFVGLLFFSLAGPQWERGFLTPNRRASVIVILDNSASMGYADNFKRAQGLADELIARYSAAAEVYVTGLVQSDDSNRFYWMTPGSGREHLKRIQLSNGTATLRDALERITDPRPSYALECVYVGDGQELHFRDFARETVRMRAAQIERLYWLKVRTGSNAGIVDVRRPETVTGRNEPYPLRVRLTNYTGRRWPGRLEARSGGYSNRREIVLAPSQDHEESFDIPRSVRQVEFRWQDDSLVFDNRYFFARSDPEVVRVLVVGSQRNVSRALQPQPDTAGIFQVHTSLQVGLLDLRGYDAVVLDRIPDITPAERLRLEHFLALPERAVVCLLGPEAGPGLREFLRPAVDLIKTVAPVGYAAPEWVDLKSPFFNVFQGTAGLKDVKFYRYWQMRSRGTVAASLPGGEPLVVSGGNRVVVASSADPSDSDLMYKSAFVPLVHRLILGGLAPLIIGPLAVGDHSGFDRPAFGPGGEPVNPGQRFNLPGFYAVAGETVAVNVTVEEGNLTIISGAMADRLNVVEIDPDRQSGIGDLSRIALIAALAMILLEQVLLVL